MTYAGGWRSSLGCALKTFGSSMAVEASAWPQLEHPAAMDA